MLKTQGPNRAKKVATWCMRGFKLSLECVGVYLPLRVSSSHHFWTKLTLTESKNFVAQFLIFRISSKLF